MSAELSDFAIRRILKVLDDARPNPYEGGAEAAGEVNQRWSVIYRLYFVIEPTPSLDYMRSAEFTLALKGYDAGAIFAHGKPLVFEECPDLLGARLVEVCETNLRYHSFSSFAFGAGQLGTRLSAGFGSKNSHMNSIFRFFSPAAGSNAITDGNRKYFNISWLFWLLSYFPLC